MGNKITSFRTCFLLLERKMWQTEEEVTKDLELMSDFSVPCVVYPKPSQKEIEKKSTKVHISIYEDDTEDTETSKDDDQLIFEEHQARITEEIRGVSWYNTYITCTLLKGF